MQSDCYPRRVQRQFETHWFCLGCYRPFKIGETYILPSLVSGIPTHFHPDCYSRRNQPVMVQEELF